MTARFFAPDARHEGQIVSLPAFEAEHLTRVLRLGAGDPVRIFDGGGREFDAAIIRTARSAADVRIVAPAAAAPEHRIRIVLAQALLKGDKMDDVVRDAVMLGAAAMQPVLADRSEMTRASLERSHRRERWHRIAIASSKQCGRAVVPAILPAAPLDDVLSADSGHGRPGIYMFVEPGAAATPGAFDAGPAPEGGALVVIGPEGGWSDRELALAPERARTVTLRGPTLRADAMPVVALTALLTGWGEL